MLYKQIIEVKVISMQNRIVNLVRFLNYHNLESSANIFLKVNNGNTRDQCHIYLKLALKIPERRD